MNRSKQLILSGAVGAALAAAVIVTVYEGHLLADSKTGTRVEVDGRTIVAAAPASLDEATASREQLVARTQTQHQEITKLKARLAELEKGSASTGLTDAEEGRAWHDPSPKRLKEWVAECHVRHDEPGLDRWQPQKTLGKNERGLEPSELLQVNAAISEVQQYWKQLVRSLYIEATGEVQGADTLSTEAMRTEIEEKSGDEQSNVLQRIAQERAGMIPPPTDLSKTTPFERMFRAYLDLGNRSEAALAKRLGADRAKAIRGDGWSSRGDYSGCPQSE